MATVDSGRVAESIRTLLQELFEGAGTDAAWVINRGEPGILATLEGVPAEDASRHAIPGRATLAGHADHLRFALSLLNRYAAGEEDVFENADWDGSWRRQEVDEATWREIRDDLAREARSWTGSVAGIRPWEPIVLTGCLSSAVHAAYHFGAMRQILGGLGRD